MSIVATHVWAHSPPTSVVKEYGQDHLVWQNQCGVPIEFNLSKVVYESDLPQKIAAACSRLYWLWHLVSTNKEIGSVLNFTWFTGSFYKTDLWMVCYRGNKKPILVLIRGCILSKWVHKGNAQETVHGSVWQVASTLYFGLTGKSPSEPEKGIHPI